MEPDRADDIWPRKRVRSAGESVSGMEIGEMGRRTWETGCDDGDGGFDHGNGACQHGFVLLGVVGSND